MIKLFLCGDVMTGRGIDQVLPHPGDPRLCESHVRSALGYVELGEAASGTIERPVDFGYIWGDSLAELHLRGPAARIVNLETAVTAKGQPWPGKGIHYRMNPANIPALTAAGIDCCVLANNHMLDFGRDGLTDTLAALSVARIAASGAGANREQASVPAQVGVEGNRRILVFAFATRDSGVPPDWAAADDRAGVNFLPDLSARSLDRVAAEIRLHRRPDDLVVVSMHWGGNWGYDVPREEREFAHGLVDAGGADLVHGHSSHHAKGIEVHRGKLILYGCGDFVNDYEGIRGYESFRTDLALMYFPELDASGQLLRLAMVPLRRQRFRLERARPADSDWLCKAMTSAGRRLGTRLATGTGTGLELRWD
jgi:poly-gamma-glutamate synthesis protein (capsule biosynthesis protein)